MVRTLDAAIFATDVGVLARVFFHVRPLYLYAENRAVLELHIQPTVIADRFIVLRGLEGLGQVGIKVVLAGKTAVFGDGAVQRQADADGVLYRGLVHHRQ